MALRSWSETQALNLAVADPNSDATPSASGMDLNNVMAFAVSLSAESTRTLTGGTLLCWWWNPVLARWVRNKDLDLIVPASIGVRDVSWYQQQTFVPFGRVLYANSGITVSGGTTATPRIDAFGKTFLRS